MSDSETDLFPSNIYRFRNESTTVSAKGPNITSTNLTGLNFQSNVLSSTMQPRNFERSRYAESVCDQRSMYYRRETSPMSMYSGLDRPRNFHNSFYPGRMSSQRSVYSGRGGSPMSMRSLDSNVSVSAADIALAFKNVKFNKYDLRVIKDAYNKLMKKRIRKKIEKRRNMRLFLKGYRRKSGYDSGEQGSDSSISSSDDSRSINSAICKDNTSSCRSTRTDIATFRQNIRESNMYNDRTDNFRSNAIKNIYPLYSSNTREQFNSQMHHMTTETHNITKTTQHILNTKKSMQATRNILDSSAPNKISNSHNSQTYQSQRERFKNSFLLPSQRFNKSTASVPIPEKDVHDKSIASCSNEGKRNLETEDNVCSDNKRMKLSVSNQVKSTAKPSNNKSSTVLKECNNNKDNIQEKKADDFEFVKPQFPIQRTVPGKVKEILISKSNAPLTDVTVPPLPTVPKENISAPPDDIKKSNKPNAINEKLSNNVISEKQIVEPVDIIHDSTDMSMRPSFIKRKLFTQKMDMTESKNISADAININSPQVDIYSAIQREKHKARKLVTNQSCLNRDVNQEDSNLLELIHKIVPPDRMNVTNVSSKTSRNSKSSHDIKNCDEDKWDVTSVITTCNNDDVSDTYTDEDIFNDNSKKNRNSKKQEKPVKNNPTNPVQECRVVIENNLKMTIEKSGSKGDNKDTGLNCAKLFWDTDFESDVENTIIKKSSVVEHSKTGLSNSSIQTSINISKSDRSLSQLNDLMTKETPAKHTNTTVVGPTLKKYKINKNLTIKAFGTPINIKADLNHKNVKEKPSKNPKEQVTQKHSTVVSKSNKNATVQNKNSSTTQKTEKKVESKEKIPQKEKVAKSKPDSKLKEEPKTVTRTAKSKSSTTPNDISDISVLSRSHRTPKIKMCCGNKVEKEDKTKTVNPKAKTEKKNLKESNIKANLKTANKAKNITIEKEDHKRKNARRKPPTPIENSVIACEPMNRTLRTRTVNLSSSFNTSNENITNITVKCLRTRQINLSSSMENSTLGGNIVMTKKVQKLTQTKKKLK